MLPDQIAAAVRHHSWLFLLRGIAAVAFGVLTLWWPGATLVVLMAFITVAFPGVTVAAVLVFIAWFALVIGIVQLVVAFRVRTLVKAVAAV